MDSVAFLRERFAPEMVSAMALIEGQVGIIGNNTMVMAGAITAAAQVNAKALNAAALFGIDDVIDPAETRPPTSYTC